MFAPTTTRLEALAELFPETVKTLEGIFDKETSIYIDYANVVHWQDRLGWRIDLNRLKQLVASFSTVKSIKLYYGTLTGDSRSERMIRKMQSWGYDVRTKPVKHMKFSIDTSSISPDSPALIRQFIKPTLLTRLDIESIKFLNSKLRDLNKQGVKMLTDRKCNFDVEIGRDMLLDFHDDHTENFVLWSGDSDFAEPIEHLMGNAHKVYLFATARRVAVELAETKVPIFDLRKIREFICFPRDIPQGVKDQLLAIESQKDSLRSP